MTVCDACKKEITEASGFEISIKHKDSVARYDGCSVKCCAKMLHELAEQWDKDSRNQG